MKVMKLNSIAVKAISVSVSPDIFTILLSSGYIFISLHTGKEGLSFLLGPSTLLKIAFTLARSSLGENGFIK